MHRLPPDTACRVRASARLPTLECVVHELVARAVEAGARRVHVDVDLQAWRVVCVDDGHGDVDAWELRPDAHGLRHTPPMACLPWLSLLEVHGQRRMLVQREHRVLHRGPSKHRDTRVVLHDVFGGVPVRRRYLARRRQRTMHRLRMRLYAWAHARPSVRITGLGLRDAVPAGRSIHAALTFRTRQDEAWTAKLDGTVGDARAYHFVALNGTPHGFACRDDVPWSGSWWTPLYGVLRSSFALRLEVHRAQTMPEVVLPGWTALWERLCQAPPVPRAQGPRAVPLMTREPTASLVLPASLDRVRAIAQVDNKYVLCLCDASLLCVDQHAVDERIRMERDLTAYVMACLGGEGHSRAIEPCTVPLPAHVVETLRFWGWDAVRGHDDTWHVRAVPAIVPRHADVAQVVTQCATWTAEHADDIRTWLRTAMHAQHGAMSALRYLPPVLRGMLASHACHTALRFEQSLSREQCDQLVAQWRHTTLPFVCAHHRPSAVCVARVPAARPTPFPVRWHVLSQLA